MQHSAPDQHTNACTDVNAQMYILPDANTLRDDLHSIIDRLVDQLDALYAAQDALTARMDDLERVTAPTLYSASEVEALLGISDTTRRELTLRGDLPVVHIDSRPKFRKSDVEALVARKKQVA